MSSFLCRGCSCNFADVANLKRHLNASPACKTKKVTSLSSSNVVAHVPLSKKVHSSFTKKVSSTNALMNGVCGALSSWNLQRAGSPRTKTVFQVPATQLAPVAVPAVPRNVKQVMFVIDESGSMSGTRFREAIDGFKIVLKWLTGFVLGVIYWLFYVLYEFVVGVFIMIRSLVK